MIRRIRGFSMVELLVAVLVMGVGVLGVTALQLMSLQNNRSALLRAEAVQMAYDMMDRVRANPVGAVAGVAYDGLAIGDNPPAATDCVANNCTEAQIIAFDQAVWKCSLGTFNAVAACAAFRAGAVLPPATAQPGLPNGDGSVAVDAAGIVTIVVRWQEPNNQVQSITIDSQV
jgi:type IV pilus modification protein PilV